MERLLTSGQFKEDLYALSGNVPGLGRIVLASHF
jgi:hypothetical protein